MEMTNTSNSNVDDMTGLTDIIYHIGMGLVNLWSLACNFIIITLIISKKTMRTDGQKILVINICVCLICDALLGLFTQTRDVVEEVQHWYQMTGPCEAILITQLVVDILIPYSLFLLCVDLCVQLKDPPFYAPSAGRSMCMVLCDWLLSVALTFLLLFGVGRIERVEQTPECFTHLTMLYNITERCITFFTPAVLLLVGILFLVGLSCRERTITTLELHRGNPDIVVIQHAKRLAPPVAVICVFFLLAWIPYNVIYFIHVVLYDSSVLFYMNICKHVSMCIGAIVPLLWLSVDPDLRRACCGCCNPPRRDDLN